MLVLSSLALVGCGIAEIPGRGMDLLANRDGGELRATRGGVLSLGGPSSARTGSQRSLGTDEFLASGAPTPNLFEVSDEGEITLNLVDVPLEQAARAVLGDALGRNYTIQPGVTGTVTLQTTRPVSQRALLETFQTILELNGATLKGAGDLITIVPLDGAPRRVGRIGDPGGGSARVIAVPLQYVGTAEMTRLLQPIVGTSVGLQPIPGRNILLISGAREEINAAIDAVNLFDVDVLQGKSVAIVKLNAAEPAAVAAELQQLFEAQEGGSLEGVISFTPSQRLGAVLVVTSRARYLERAERMARDLDRTAGGATRRPVVYSLQSRSAAELAPILTSMLEAGVQEAGQALEGVPSAGVPRIVADDARNALIVFGDDPEQARLSRLIQSLDSAPVQVLLEATIAEVSLTDELRFGLRYFFESGNLRGTLSDASDGAVAPTFPGLSVVFRGSSSAVALDALSSITDVDVVSSPSLMVLDNQEAQLQIGDQVPVATQQVREIGDPDAPIVSTISFRDTGIILTVRPRVSASGQVIMDIQQEVSSVENTTTSGIDSPTISQRRIQTSVAVLDGQTIALGGLIEERRGRNERGVPGLRRVPIVGALFRSRADRIGKTELLVLITPRVVRDGYESRAITSEFRSRLRGADGLVRTGIGVPATGHRILQ